jgi:hypothetical protein
MASALQPLCAQWTITGRVVDAETRDPLPGALAILAGETRGAACDSTGRFTLRSSVTNPVINIQYLGYKILSTRLDLKQQQHYEFSLEPDPMTLPTTTIIAEGLQRVHPDPTTHVIDYEFLDGKLLLIVYDRLRKRNVLQLFSRDLRLLAEADSPDQPLNALMADCMGARHCFSEDFVAQVDYAKGNLFLRWDSMAVFNRVVAPCLASLDSTFYFAFMPHNYAKAFTYLHAGATKRKYLYGTIDKQALEVIRDEGMAAVRTNSNEDVPITSSFASPELMRAMFQSELNARDLSTVVCPPLYVPIKAVRSSIYIFDHPHDLLLRFDELGECRDTLHITYNALRDWRKEIIIDEEGQEAYTLTEKDGFTRLHRIDLVAGTLAESWELPHPFPLKIKVMDDYIYFTYRDNAGDATKRLYRMQM